MASSGAAVGAFTGRSSFDLRLIVSLSQTDEANNRARWAWTLRVDNPGGGSGTWSGGSGSYSARVNNVLVGSGTSSPFDFRDGAAYHVVASGVTGWIQYGTNGAKTIPIQAAFSSSTIFGSAGTGVVNVVADAIPHPAHTGLMITRVSDTQHSLNWSRAGTYSSAVVQRRTDDGAWQQVGAPTGNAFSFTDTTTQANHKYEYRVAGKAGNAQSAWSGTATVFTTPAAPTGVSAARSGDDIVVSASSVPPYASSFDVRDGATLIATSVTLPFTHADPNPALAHTYTVRAKVGALASGYSAASNTVQLLAAPNAPVSLSPNGAVRAGDGDVVFSWVHNPVDSSLQSAYELRHRTGGGAWTTLTGSTASTRAVALPVAAYEWQVRTKGQHPDFSPWSATATVTVIDRPGVAITQPDDDWDASVLTVQWSWFQAQSRPQSAWELRLLDADSALVESRSGTGATASVTVNHRLVEGAWTIEVRAATGDVWSEWAQESFTTVFDPPAPPALTGAWDEEQGGVALTVASGDPSGPVDEVTNLFTNPSFETGSGTLEVRRNLAKYPGDAPTGTTGWGGYRSTLTNPGGYIRAEVNEAAGNAAAGITGTVSSGTMVAVTPGDTMSLSVELRSLSLLVGVGWQFYDSASAYVAGSQGYGTIITGHGTNWTVSSGSVVVPAGAAYLRPMVFFRQDVAVGQVVHLRRMTVERALTPGVPFSGNASPDAEMTPSWVSTANASESILTGVAASGVTGAGHTGARGFRSSAWAASGATSLRIVAAGSGGAGNAAVPIPTSGIMTVGKAYTVLASVRLTAPLTGTSETYSRRLRLSGTGIPALTLSPQAPNEAGTHTIRWTVAVPAGAGPTTLQLWHGGYPGSPDIWFDDLAIIEGVYEGEYFDGSTPIVDVNGISRLPGWDGLANASTSTTGPFATTTTVTLERSVDGGVTWEPVIDTIDGATLIDWESLSYGDTLYRATASTAEGAASVTELTVQARSTALWLSGGVGFADAARLPLNPNVEHTSGRERALKRYAGRSFPVTVSGEGVSRSIAVSGNVWDRARGEIAEASPNDLVALSQSEEGLFLFRDPDGRRVYGVIGEIRLPREAASSDADGWNGYWGYSFTLTEATR